MSTPIVIADDLPSAPDQVQAMVDEANRLCEADEDSAALELAGRAAELATAGAWGDIEFRARLVVCLSAIALGQGEVAASAAAQAFGLAAHRGNTEEMATALVAQATVSKSVGDFEQALLSLDKAWPTLRTSRNLRERFRAEGIFARCHSQLGDHAQAVEWYDRSLRTAHESGVEFVPARSMHALAGAWLDHGDELQRLGEATQAQLAWGKAIDLGRAAQAETRASGRPSDVVIASLDLAASLGRVGQLAEAMALLDAVAEQSAAHGGMLWTVVTLNLERCRIMAKLGRVEEAEHELAQAIASAETRSFTNGLDDLYALKSSLAEGRGAFASALADLKRSHALRERTRSDRAQLRSRVLSAQYGVERARAEAETEHQRYMTLTATNQALEERASSLLEQAQVDALTGLANRRSLDMHLAVQHASARARGMPLCVAMIDIDHFKQVNDRFSHSVGDEVLREMALTMKKVCRDGDFVARYGGEEFTVVFAEIGLTVAAQACERLRAAVQERAWDRLAPGLAVTISLGLTDVGSDPDPLQGLRRADALLYRAKQGGRNRIVVEP